MATSNEFWNHFVGQELGAAPRATPEQLEQRIERQALVLRALWELLKNQASLEEHDLVAKVAEIDLRDGALDHQLRAPLLDCPDCGKKVNARRRVCAYCGFKDFPVDVFEML